MIDLFDNTSLSTFKLCPKKYYYRMTLHLTPIVSVNYKAEYGTAFHKAMEVWYQTQSLDKAITVFNEHWLPFEGMDSSNLRTLLNGVKLLSEYVSLYPIEPFKVKQIEIGFISELSNHYLYQGKCDGLVEHNDGKLYILEHKTSAAKGYISLNPNNQIDGYIYGVGQISKLPIHGCILNQVYISKKQNEFVREMTTRNPLDISNFIIDTITWCDGVNRCNDSGIWPKNTNNCNAYWKACEYKMLCSSPPESLPSIEENCFIKSEWLPNRREDAIK